MTTKTTIDGQVARINGVALNAAGETPSAEELRQRACTELLRQAAQAAGMLAASDAPSGDGVISEAASAAIELLLERELDSPEPSEEACRRHHAAHEAAYSTGERVRARHILFAVTPGVDVVALRKRAETILLDVRCHDGQAAEGFADAPTGLRHRIAPISAPAGRCGDRRRCRPGRCRYAFTAVTPTFAEVSAASRRATSPSQQPRQLPPLRQGRRRAA
jgi:peptidyl-prolyl cis-trans isomerase C